ncbi:MAG: GumC family protein [Granulosicoccus sp.]
MNSRANELGFDDFDDMDDGVDPENRSMADQIDLQHYLRILRKYKWSIVLFTALITGLAGYYAYTATPIYSASSTLLIEQQQLNVASIEELYGADNNSSDYYLTQFEILKSRTLAIKVIDSLDMWRDEELLYTPDGDDGSTIDTTAAFNQSSFDNSGASDNAGLPVNEAVSDATMEAAVFGQSAVNLQQFSGAVVATSPSAEGLSTRQKEAVVSRYMAKAGVTPVRNTKLVKLSYQSTSPVKAARVANAIGEQYIESYLDAKMELTTKASAWLQERLASLKETLDASEQRLLNFKQENGLVDVDGSVGRLNETQLILLTTELSTARSELSDAEDLFRDVQASSGNPDLLRSVATVQADPLVRQVQVELGQAQRNLDELLNRYGERHPRVVDATSQLRTLNATLDGHLQRVAQSVNKDVQLLRQRVASIEAQLGAGKQEIQLLGTKKFALDAMEREAATNRGIYDTFFSRMSEARSADGLESANARISDYAVPANYPIKPKKQLIIALAALSSLILSMLMAFLYEQMDDTVKGVDDVERKIGVNLLGIMPLLKSGILRREKKLPLNPLEIEDKKGTFGESINTIRTALFLKAKERETQVIMITSSIPSEGKSTTSINLAYSFGQMEKTLLIDCDMRRPTVGSAAGLPSNCPGLSSLITRSQPAKACIQKGVFGGSMDVITAGPMPENPLEILSSERFKTVISQLRNHYDRIIVDSAPTQAVSDALVLSKVCDAVVYCVKSHSTSINLVKRGIQRLNQVNGTIAGAVMTQVDMDKLVSYGGDYYYQGYYDYYGYTDKGVAKGGESRGRLHLSAEQVREMRDDDEKFDFGLETRGGNAPVDEDVFDLTMDLGEETRLASRRRANLDVL